MNFQLEKAYCKDSFIEYLEYSLLPDFKHDERKVELDDNCFFIEMTQLGTASACDVSVFEATCTEKASNKRITLTQNAFRILRKHGISNAIIAFISETSQWRLSLLTSKMELIDGKIISKFNSPRRYSYLLGEGARVHTPYKYLVAKGSVSSLADLLGRFSVEVVNKQFYDEIAKHFTELVGGERGGNTYHGLLDIYGTPQLSVKCQEFAVRLIGRIMFCWFLKEKKSPNGVALVPETMLSKNAVIGADDYYHSILEPLFFELLNTKAKKRKVFFKSEHFSSIPYLNGGLFNPQKPDDHYKFSETLAGGERGVVTIPNSWFTSLFDVLESYNFTVDENTTYDVELSIDPEMLGRIFENLLAEINPETGESAKKSTGSFYTPRDIVDYMVDTSLIQYLKRKTNIDEFKLCKIISYGQEEDEEIVLTIDDRVRVVDALHSLAVLDPACGSGAFPIGMLQKIVYILQQVDPNSKLWVEKQFKSVTSAELKQEIKFKLERGLFDYIRKLGVIRESIYGVDIQTIAIEIAKLRCFLSLIVEETVEDDEPNRGIQPLPNLDFKFITANSLVSLKGKAESVGQISLFEDIQHIEELKRIRDEYFIADTDERAELREEFGKIQREMLMMTIQNYAKTASNRYNLLSSWKPFDNESTHWFDPAWMFGNEKFDIIIANPPYIHLEHIKEQSQYYKEMNFSTYEARGDIYALFFEKGINLLRENGILCYITSNQWMRTAYGKSLRAFFAKHTNPIQIIDFAGQQIFEATVNTNILLLSKSANEKSTNAVTVKDKESLSNLSAYIKQYSVKNSFDTDQSWTILSPIEQSIKEKIESIGTPLKDWDISINYGIKTGCNEAFIINQAKRDELIQKDPKSAEIIRPILRGRDIKRYGYDFVNLYVILAYYGSHKIIPEQYPAIYEHLISYESELRSRGQCRYASSGRINSKSEFPGQHHWLELDNNPRKEYLDDFSKQKIVWGNLSLHASFSFTRDNIFINAPSCMIVSNDLCLLAILNSKLADFYIRNLGVARNGGYFEYKPMFVQEFPAIKIAGKEKEQLENLVDMVMASENKTISLMLQNEIDNVVFSLYRLSSEEIDFVRSICD